MKEMLVSMITLKNQTDEALEDRKKWLYISEGLHEVIKDIEVSNK